MHLSRVRRENRRTFLSSSSDRGLLGVAIDIMNHITVVCLCLGSIRQKTHFITEAIIPTITGGVFRNDQPYIRFSAISVENNVNSATPFIFLCRSRFAPAP